jgi:radical SAM superfamily enzyme YgiQ (UPF0313 family)
MSHIIVNPSAPALDAAKSDEPPLPPLGPQLKVLLVCPRFLPSFWSMAGMLDMLPADCFQPPLGLITVAALCPAGWTLRLIDRNCQPLRDADLRWADLVMVTSMRVQVDDMREVLQQARALGKRTIVGGPLASSQPDLLLPLADHVVVGEPDEVFGTIAADLERGTARRLYVIDDKPDISKTPIPRFDLLDRDKYLSMTVQFSRGCPFQCEFCDIITVYGRKPRTKTPDQVLRELDTLLALGWRNRVFMVDDNFIGNHKRALELADRIAAWQVERGFPLLFSTEASIDLAQYPALIDAMVRANFWSVFVGIESPSPEALAETKKFQNLRKDPLESIRTIQRGGLLVTAGFIVGFDSDTDAIFDRQVEFIERSAIVWAMTGFLQALPTTPLHARMARDGRLLPDVGKGNFKPPNFRTIMPRAALLAGGRRTLQSIYHPAQFFDRALRSLDEWSASELHHAPSQSGAMMRRVLLRSMLRQGIISSYRRHYWRYLFQLVRRWRRHPQKRWQGFVILISGHHFIQYAVDVIAELDEALGTLDAEVAV